MSLKTQCPFKPEPAPSRQLTSQRNMRQRAVAPPRGRRLRDALHLDDARGKARRRVRRRAARRCRQHARRQRRQERRLPVGRLVEILFRGRRLAHKAAAARRAAYTVETLTVQLVSQGRMPDGGAAGGGNVASL